MVRTILLVVSVVIVAGGCGHPGRVEPGPDPARPPDGASASPGEPVIGHLAMPDRVITIRAGGPRFEIHDAAGRPIAGDLSLESLIAEDPAAGAIYATGIAGKPGPGGREMSIGSLPAVTAIPRLEARFTGE